MTDRTEQALKAKLRRLSGASEETSVKLKAFNEAQTDWTGTCRVCGVKLTGTLAAIREHTHGEAS